MFIGPAAILASDGPPSVMDLGCFFNTASDWETAEVYIGPGPDTGAPCVRTAQVTIGVWGPRASGSVLTTDVPDHALLTGVHAIQLGCVGRTGLHLGEARPDEFACHETEEPFVESAGHLETVEEIEQ